MADSPDKLKSLTERPLIRRTAERSQRASCALAPTSTALCRAAWPCQLRPTDTGAPSHAAPGHDAAPPGLPCSLDGGSGGGSVSRPSGRRRRARDRRRGARPGATRACAPAMNTADRRATRGASGSSRPPPAPRSLPADAAARRSRGKPKRQSRKLDGASQPMRNTMAARRRLASLRPRVPSCSSTASPGAVRPRRRPGRSGSARAGRRRRGR